MNGLRVEPGWRRARGRVHLAVVLGIEVVHRSHHGQHVARLVVQDHRSPGGHRAPSQVGDAPAHDGLDLPLQGQVQGGLHARPGGERITMGREDPVHEVGSQEPLPPRLGADLLVPCLLPRRTLDEAAGQHAVEDPQLARPQSLRMTPGVIQLGSTGDRCQPGRLGQAHLGGRAVEVQPCRGLHPHCVVPVRNRVQVGREDLVLRGHRLEPQRLQPLVALAQQAPRNARVGGHGRPGVGNQLLGDGRSPLDHGPCLQVPHQRSQDPPGVHAMVLEEAMILCCQRGACHVGGRVHPCRAPASAMPRPDLPQHVAVTIHDLHAAGRARGQGSFRHRHQANEQCQGQHHRAPCHQQGPRPATRALGQSPHGVESPCSSRMW